MSKIYQATTTAIEDWLQSLMLELVPQTAIAVFGAGPYARHIAASLTQHGYHKMYFLLSEPRLSHLDGCPVISLTQLAEHGIETILAGSMAEPLAQQHALDIAGSTLPFYYLQGGELLCSEPRYNPCNQQQLEELRNKHKGETFFIIGNGPSLNLTPPEQISNGVCLAGNGIILRQDFVPDYYFLLEERALEHWQQRIQTLQTPKLLASHLHFQHAQVQHNNAHELIYFPACFRSDTDNVDPYQFGIPSGGTIISSMLYFAVYMGAKQAIIIGVDNNYQGAQQQTHFAPGYYTEQRKPWTEDKALIIANRQKQGILRAARVAKANGVNVYDATPVKNNLGIEKIDFKQVNINL